jgi:PTS system fructose-specific IIA component/PTS system nitrogen regulatory IIA component
MGVTTKREVIETLVDRLVELGRLPKSIVDEAISALLAREELGSTGIGRGVAVPHATLPSLSQTAFITGYVPKGIDFDSPDRRPVNRVFLALTPPHLSAEWKLTLEKISRYLRSVGG